VLKRSKKLRTKEENQCLAAGIAEVKFDQIWCVACLIKWEVILQKWCT